jgi:hypothetical protein
MSNKLLQLLHESFGYTEETEKFLDTTPLPVDYIVEIREELDILKDRIFALTDTTATEWINYNAIDKIVNDLNTLTTAPIGIDFLIQTAINRLGIDRRELGKIITTMYDYIDILYIILGDKKISVPKNKGELNIILQHIGNALTLLVEAADAIIDKQNSLSPLDIMTKDMRLN